jgi:dolichol-phosphate mannosyltransferase
VALPVANVLVVDDNSPDGTGELADALANREERVRVLHRPGKQGLGRAYVAAYREALRGTYERVFQMDADFSHDPRHLPELRAAADDADLVLGSRYVRGGRVLGWGRLRQLISRGGNTYARAVLGVPYHDLTGGFKCWRRRLLGMLDLERLRSDGYAFQIETTYRAHRLGMRVREVPIVFRNREVGRSKMALRIVMEAWPRVLELRWKALTGRL